MGLLDLKLILIICLSIIVYFLYKEILSIRYRLNVITKQVSTISSISLIKDNIKPDISNSIITTSSDSVTDSVSDEESSGNILNMITNMFNKKNKCTLNKCNNNMVDSYNNMVDSCNNNMVDSCNNNMVDSCCNYNILDPTKKIHKISYSIPLETLEKPNLESLETTVQNTKIINIEYKQMFGVDEQNEQKPIDQDEQNEQKHIEENEQKPIEENEHTLDKQDLSIKKINNTESSEENISHLEVFSNDTENKKVLETSSSNESSSSNKSGSSNNKTVSSNNKSDSSNNKTVTSNNESGSSINKSNKSSTFNNLNNKIEISESNTIMTDSNTILTESNNNKSLTRLKLPELQDKALELKIPLSVNGKKKTRVELINDIRNHM